MKEEINKTITNLYEDKISSTISLETFKILIKKYEKQKKELDMKISAISKSNENIQKISRRRKAFFTFHENLKKADK